MVIILGLLRSRRGVAGGVYCYLRPAMFGYSKFSWVFVCKSSEEGTTDESSDRSRRYVWGPEDVKVVKRQGNKVEKWDEKLPKPAGISTPKPKEITTPKAASPKPDRHDADRGMPLWHVSQNWVDGPHIKTPDGWIPYDHFNSHELRDTKFDSDKSALAKILMFLKLNDIKGRPRLAKLIRENSEILDHYGIDWKKAEKALSEGEAIYSGSFWVRLRDAYEARGIPGSVENIGGEDYKTFKEGWNSEFYIKHKGDKYADRMTSEGKQAVEIYGGGTGRGDIAERINRKLRDEKYNDLDTDEQAVVNGLDSAISKSVAEDNLVVYRGVGVDFLQRLGALKGEDIVGTEMSDAGYVSTSLVEDEAKKFIGTSEHNVLITIKVPKGSNICYADNHKTSYQDEEEILLPRGSKFVVESAYSAPGRPHKIVLKYSGVGGD